MMIMAIVPAFFPSSFATSIGLTVTPLVAEGGRLDWSQALNLIVFDKRHTGNYFDIFTMNPDGSNQICLTCDHPQLTNKHIGNPAWYPNGNFIVFQMEKAEHNGNSDEATPGIGINNDIWIMNQTATVFYQITNVPEGMGVLHPHFSDDGTKLTWAERVGGNAGTPGIWTIKVLHLITRQNNQLTIGNIESYQPVGQTLYETHGFSPDGSKLIFTAVSYPDQTTLSWLDIYTFDLTNQQLTPLTLSYNMWDEHAQYSPDGSRIIWMSSRDCNCNPYQAEDLYTDYWIMTINGGNKTRLTYFNQPGHPHYIPDQRTVVADLAWSPNGQSIMAYIQVGEPIRPYDGSIVRIDFTP